MKAGLLGILASQNPLQPHLEAWGIMAVVTLLLVGVPVLALRRLRHVGAEAPWQQILDEAGRRAGTKRGPEVTFEFHTYSGFLVFFRQTTHKPRLPAPIALEYLKGLHRYNLVNCLVPDPGIAFVPLLSWLEYRG